MFLSLFLVNFLFFVQSIDLVQQSVLRGIQTTHLVYNQEEIKGLKYIAVQSQNDQIYILGVINGKTPNVICRETITTQIIVARKGCDNKKEDNSIIRSNCGHKTVEGLNNYWYLPRTDYRCLQAPQSSTCLGPVYLFSTGQEYNELIDDDLLLLEGAFLLSGKGPACSLPTITRVDIKLPTLNITSSCSFLPSGEYKADTQETQHGQYTFILLTTTVIITPSSNQLDVYFVSSLVYSYSPFQFNQVYNDTGCLYSISLIKVSKPLEINSLSIPNLSNYFKNNYEFINRDMICNFGVGQKRFENNKSLFYGIPPQVPFGGKPILKSPNGVPFKINPDPRFNDFDLDCSRFYPFSETFNGFGLNGYDGPLYNRYEPAQYSCYAPFPFPERIIELVSVEERAKQCKMLGGVLATITNDVCVMVQWRTFCRRGWMFFDERCWYKFDDELEASQQVSRDESELICSRLHPDATSIFPLNLWVKAWIQRFYVFWKYPNTITRALIEGNRCQCFTSLGTETCDCEEPNFPLCSYPIKSDLPPYWDIDIHPQTIEVLRLGQEGVPMGSNPLQCECELGWTGPYCQQRTCILDIQVAPSVNQSLSNPLISFFKKCYTKQRGYCIDNSVYTCECKSGFNPPGNLLENLNIDYPCMFPSLVGTFSSHPQLVSIQGENLTLSIYGICGFYQRGIGIFEGYNDAYCSCNYRWSRTQGREIAFNGDACSCHVPHYQLGGEITETICNNHGTCCPHGNREDGQIGYCPLLFNGCYCDPGWGGESCTSFVPSHHILTRLMKITLEGETYIITKLNQRSEIGYLYLSQNLSLVTVTIRDEISTTILHECSLIEHEKWEVKNSTFESKWDCQNFIGWYIFVSASVDQALMIISTTSKLPICGVNVNLASARFFDIPEFKSDFLQEELQPFNYAQYGSTNSECHCLSGYSGSTCNIGISAWRLSEDTAQFTPRFCGDSTQPKRGKPINNICECNFIGNSITFTGDACEIAIVNGEICSNHGTPIPTSFPNGTCSFDYYHFRQDALFYPYQKEMNQNSQFMLLESNNIFLINNQTWLFPESISLGLEGITGPLNYCPKIKEYRPKITLNYLNSNQEIQPQPINLYAQVYNFSCSCFQNVSSIPDPEIWCNGTIPLPNDTTICIDNLFFIPLNSSLQQKELMTNRYFNVEIFCIKGDLHTSQNNSLFNILDCSNPVDRLLHDIISFKYDEWGIEETLPCIEEPITKYHQTLGVGYGLFLNFTPEINFKSFPWTFKHYNLIASILNYHRCDEFTTWDWIQYINEWLLSPPLLMNGSLINNTLVKTIEIVSFEPLDGLYILDQFEQVCSTYLYPIPANTLISIPCLCPQSCLSVLKLDLQEINGTLSGFYYDELFQSEINYYRDLILKQKQFPLNTPLLTKWCGANNQTLNLNSTEDQSYLFRFYNVHLAPRTCSQNRHCHLFYPDSTCIFDTSNHQAWLNGDELNDAAFGNEGGCDCSTDNTGFFSFSTFCSTCVLGYGPDSDYEIRSMNDYALLIGNNWIENGIENVTRCSLPVDPISTRKSIICGGKGFVKKEYTRVEFNATILNNQFIRRCEYIILENGIKYKLLDYDWVQKGLSSYQYGNEIISEIWDKLYFENGTRITSWTCQERMSQNQYEFPFYTINGKVLNKRQEEFYLSQI